MGKGARPACFRRQALVTGGVKPRALAFGMPLGENGQSAWNFASTRRRRSRVPVVVFRQRLRTILDISRKNSCDRQALESVPAGSPRRLGRIERRSPGSCGSIHSYDAVGPLVVDVDHCLRSETLARAEGRGSHLGGLRIREPRPTRLWERLRGPIRRRARRSRDSGCVIARFGCAVHACADAGRRTFGGRLSVVLD